ncbi:DUF2207 domain-containing protein [Porphyromonas macacae]|uniref:DUF2207 domain-containing protein n=1 Tax=Porphyromonas macacae TaxID=28115 RepID=UPI0024AE851F|nr:DUF2207 domain-containing protein [Porphyromonas macacae]
MFPLFVLLCILFPTNILGQSSEERGISFHADLTVKSSGLLEVTETIKIYANGEKFKRGIYRVLPARRFINGRKVNISYKILSVHKNGEQEPFFEKENQEEDTYIIYIGDKNVFLSSGEYTYVITYQTKNQIGIFEQYDELYWNVNGFGWEIGFDSLSASVHLPEKTSILQHSCYTGDKGSKASDCIWEKKSDRLISFKTTDMPQGHNLTIAVGFTPGVVQVSGIERFSVLYLKYIIGGVFIFFAILFFSFTWHRYGRDPQKPAIYPAFRSPHNLSPGAIGVAVNKNNVANNLVASITNLCVKGFLKISEAEERVFLSKKKNVTLHCLKFPDSNQLLPKEELLILNSLFSSENKSFTFSGQYNKSIAEIFSKFNEYAWMEKKEMITVSKHVWLKILAVCLFVLWVFLDYFFLEEEAFRFSCILFFLPVILLPYIVIGKKRKTNKKKILSFFIFLSVLITIFTGVFLLHLSPWTIFVGTFLTLQILLYFRLIEKKSVEYQNLLSEIEGFKMYLGAAERKRLEIFNPPHVTPDVFEKFLPYAIALEVADVWGKRFKEELRNASLTKQETTPVSGWYDTNRIARTQTSLVDSLVQGLSISLASASIDPSKGNSSSGSGGFGYSGGGGGGGGGGGW